MSKEQVGFSDKRILVTGAAGFIGAAVAKRLVESSAAQFVIGIDNLSDYYDVALKQARLAQIEARPGPLWKPISQTPRSSTNSSTAIVLTS